MTDQTNLATTFALAANVPIPHILLVEDDAEISRTLSESLSECGFAVTCVNSGSAMDGAMRAHTFDLVLLDIMLPGEDGLSICRRIRAYSAIPIIMLTALTEEIERVVGLELGADDYVGKPFSARELIARIRALLRRSAAAQQDGLAPARQMEFEGWIIDPSARQLRNPRGAQVPLTSAEFDLLFALCRNPNRVLSREQLLGLTHSGLAGPVERSVDVHISRIRLKIERDAHKPVLIKTVRLGGYIFTPAVRTR
jgi:two-component system OmpR family response regulator